MGRKTDQLKAKDRDALVQALIEKYETEPAVVEKALPEVAQLLKEQISRSGEKSGWEIFKMTRREEEERWQSYREHVKRIGDGKAALCKEEAIAALEDAAALAEGFLKASLELNSKDIMKLVKMATGLSLSKKGISRRLVVREGVPARSVNLLRGVQVDLTWDKKIMSVEVNPKELKLRDRALEFVGVGKDKTGDTAERHDDYLAGEIHNV